MQIEIIALVAGGIGTLVALASSASLSLTLMSLASGFCIGLAFVRICNKTSGD